MFKVWPFLSASHSLTEISSRWLSLTNYRLLTVPSNGSLQTFLPVFPHTRCRFSLLSRSNWKRNLGFIILLSISRSIFGHMWELSVFFSSEGNGITVLERNTFTLAFKISNKSCVSAAHAPPGTEPMWLTELMRQYYNKLSGMRQKQMQRSDGRCTRRRL